MLCIDLESDNPFFNLAVEEILLKKSNEEYLLIYINKPSVIIGKHQVLPRETDIKYITINNIPVLRRISGGGAVYHDEGNINFTFIRNTEAGKQVDFRRNTQATIDFLVSLGVDARFEGKNDLRLGGLKISGNAEHVHRNRVLHHGTLLFSTSLDVLRKCLRKDPSCYDSRGVESIRSSVTNIMESVKIFRNVGEFRSAMMNYFMENLPGTEVCYLSQDEIGEANSLAGTKYMTWEWNWGYGPDYQYNKKFNLQNESVSLSLQVKEGIIRECHIEGSEKLVKTCKKLINCRHMPVEIMTMFEKEKFIIGEQEFYNFF